MDTNTIIKVIQESSCRREVFKKLNWSIGGTNTRKLNKFILEHQVDISHFKTRTPVRFEDKICPVCNTPFVAEIRQGKKEQITCSTGCANTYFRSGNNHPNYVDGTSNYSTICFQHHGHQCAVCPESVIVEAHHLDGDRSNNTPANLVPLCPTHHRYWHSKHRYLILQKVLDYVNSFITK